jgi:tetratricopeptide (TPR) repeat protein
MVRMTERGYNDVSVRVEIIGNPRAYATLEMKPIPGEVPPGTREAASAGDPNLVSVLDLNVPENARQEFEKGQGALKENKLNDGVAHLRKAIKLYDAFPQAYTLLGTAYLGLKDWKNAEAALRRANELDPQFPDAYMELGAVFNQTKEYPQAETALLKGLELKPEAAGGHYELAKTYWALGRWQDAAPHARSAVAGMPDLAPAHALLGNVMLRESNAQGALHEYQEYLRLDPNGPMAPGVRQMIEKIQKALHP